MKAVDLKEILRSHIILNDETQVLKAMKEACDKTIDLVIENVVLSDGTEDFIGITKFNVGRQFYIDKGSILKAKTQII
jgi:hypothetical protein